MARKQKSKRGMVLLGTICFEGKCTRFENLDVIEAGKMLQNIYKRFKNILTAFQPIILVRYGEWKNWMIEAFQPLSPYPPSKIYRLGSLNYLVGNELNSENSINYN